MEIIDRNKALELIKSAKNILIAPSSPMDGDSVGSSLALMSVFKKLGKTATVVCTDTMPEALKFLPLTDQIESHLPTSKDFVISLNTVSADVDHMKYEVEPGKINIIITPKNGKFSAHDISFKSGTASFDLIITVDTGDLVQIGKLYEENKSMFENGPLLNIDHHASNGKFGTHNFLEYSAAATTQMLTPIIVELEKDSGETLIDEDVATLLLAGIITDTGSFQHSNTSPEAFEVAADLLDRGARQQEIIKHLFKTKSLATLKLWGKVLSKIKYEENSRLVYSTISLEDLEQTGAKSEDSGGIIDELMSNAPASEVVMLLKEKEPGFLSGSLRAPGNLADVSEIAGRIGGGGHKKAAGFRIKGKSLEEGLAIAIETIATYMKEVSGKAKPENVHEIPKVEAESPSTGGKLFPSLVTKAQKSIPVPSTGGEDMLLEHFKKKLNPEEAAVKEKSVKFFQDADGQEKPEMTVGDVMSHLGKD